MDSRLFSKERQSLCESEGCIPCTSDASFDPPPPNQVTRLKSITEIQSKFDGKLP